MQIFAFFVARAVTSKNKTGKKFSSRAKIETAKLFSEGSTVHFMKIYRYTGFESFFLGSLQYSSTIGCSVVADGTCNFIYM